jgi:hypothetical protein
MRYAIGKGIIIVLVQCMLMSLWVCQRREAQTAK